MSLGGRKKNVEKENKGVITISRVRSPSLVLACRGRDAPDTLLAVGRQQLEDKLSFQAASNNVIAPSEL